MVDFVQEEAGSASGLPRRSGRLAGRAKIGSTRNLPRRLVELEAGYDCRLRLLAILPGHKRRGQ
jgi:hypothetical protein